MEDKDVLIGILIRQRNDAMNKIAELGVELYKLQQPKEPTNDDISKQQLQ